MKPLTPKQQKFADAILDGKGPSDAYRSSYDTSGKPAVIAVKANEVLNHAGVAAYIAANRKKLQKVALLTRTRKLEILSDIAEGQHKPTERTNAIKVHNEMTGDNAPQEVNVFGLADLLSLIRKKKQ